MVAADLHKSIRAWEVMKPLIDVFVGFYTLCAECSATGAGAMIANMKGDWCRLKKVSVFGLM